MWSETGVVFGMFFVFPLRRKTAVDQISSISRMVAVVYGPFNLVTVIHILLVSPKGSILSSAKAKTNELLS